jgi:NADP-dependent 3-hydroxy acid dehydrogenase YdfG
LSGEGSSCSHRYLEEGDNVVLVGRSLERLQAALPPDFKPKGRPFFVAKDLNKNTVSSASLHLQNPAVAHGVGA